MFSRWENGCDIDKMVGLTFTKVYQQQGNDELVFEQADGSKFIFYHSQGCYEQVSIEDICGDLDDLVGSPIISATEDTNTGDSDWGGTYTWTFYNFSTNKGSVTVRWYGSSNGYYSETVDLCFLKGE